ncbi:MAG: EAL domain-containing protein [Janthinobacterium lividum]
MATYPKRGEFYWVWNWHPLICLVTMMSNLDVDDVSTLFSRIWDLEARLQESEDTLDAIRRGEIDALVVGGLAEGQQIYTLESSDQPYRVLIEQIQEGAVTLAEDGTVLYCNRRLAWMLGVPQERLIGTSLRPLVLAEEAVMFDQLLADAICATSRSELTFRLADGTLLPAYLSLSLLHAENRTTLLCGVITDLTEHKLHLSDLADANIRLIGEITERERVEVVLRQLELQAAVLRQQAAFAAFGELALQADDLSEILQQACRLVGEAFGTHLVKVIELQIDGINLVTRAGVGWYLDTIEKTMVRVDPGFSEGFTFGSTDPVMSSVTFTDKQLNFNGSVGNAGVQATAKVIIYSRVEGRPFGVLQIDSSEPRTFSQSDVMFMRGYANLLGAAIDRLRAVEAAQAEARRLSTILESTTDSVVLVDQNFFVTYVNRPAIALLAVDGLTVDVNFMTVYPQRADELEYRNILSALAEQRPLVFEDYVASRALWLEIRVYPSSGGLSIFFRDISAQHAMAQELLIAQTHANYLSKHDGLTDLPNRSTFLLQLERMIASSTTIDGIGVFYLDLDGFKSVNDKLGHHVGDGLLRQVAKRLLNCIRAGDMAARLGGDEFVVIQVNLDRLEHAAVLAQRVVDQLSRPYTVDGEQIIISVSVGISTTFHHDVTADELLTQADLAMYTAKTSGGSVHCFFGSQMKEDKSDKQTLKKDLRTAVADQQLELYYQPILDLKNEKIVCMEALLRWHHPRRGLVSPDIFIPIAEETGIILSIGDWVLAEACREAAKWPSDITVAVNFSPVQIRSPHIIESTLNALSKSGLEPARLEIEITESVMLNDTETIGLTLRTLKDMGIRFSLDDFGTGYSSLTYLRAFPFDKIKVDRSFICDLPEGNEAAAIVRAVMLLGQSFNVVTVAEGVETVAQAEYLRKEGYDQVQGYLFSKPVPVHKLENLIPYLSV